MEVVSAGDGWVMRRGPVAPRLWQVLPQRVCQLPWSLRRRRLVGDPAAPRNDHLRTPLLCQRQPLPSAWYNIAKAHRLNLVDAHVRPPMVGLEARKLQSLLELSDFLGVSGAPN